MFNPEQYEKEHAVICREYEEKYKDKDGVLILDGVVNLNYYEGYLFLLKEAYDKTGTEKLWHLNKWLDNKIPQGMWARVGEWVCGFGKAENGEETTYGECSSEEITNAIKKIAVVNVKKFGGQPTSDDNDLQAHVNDNSEILKKEILSVHPKVIICGYTFQYLKQIMGLSVKKSSDWTYWIDLGQGEKTLIIDYYHPAAQYPSLLMYYGIEEIYKKALRKKP